MTWRYIKDRLMLVIASVLGLLLLIPIVGMVWLVLSKAMPALNLQMLTQVTQGTGGGLANAIVGTFYVVGLGLLIAAPLGIAAGVFLGEIAPSSRFSAVVRFTTDVLAGVPSIVIGYFGYVTMVLGLGWGFSTLAGAIALALIGIPYVVRSTEIALSKVPRGMREASMALGAPLTTTVWRVSLRSAAPGVLTGVLLALSLALGETAPLLYTAGITNTLPSASLIHQPIAYLTYYVWTDYNQPIKSTQYLSFDAALILVVLVLALLVVSRVLVNRTQRHAEGRR